MAIRTAIQNPGPDGIVGNEGLLIGASFENVLAWFREMTPEERESFMVEYRKEFA